MDYTDKIFEKLSRRGIDEAVVEQSDDRTRQMRFSESRKDLFNTWSESTASIFASRGKKVVSISIKDFSKIDEAVDEVSTLLDKVPENPEFMGINPEKTTVSPRSVEPLDSEKVREYAQAMIDGAKDAGAERSSGVVYRRYSRVHLRTNYNDITYEKGGTELVIRSFVGESTGQENYHFGQVYSKLPIEPADAGRRAAETAKLGGTVKQGEAGTFTILMSPYVIGNILSYAGGFLSAHMVRTGLSLFADRLGETVASEKVTLSDDPTDYSGEGARPVDDEGSKTRKNTLIDRGVLKTYLHSYSTARLDSTETTGNAGILSPAPWQLSLKPGSENFETILRGVSDGLFINNAWYTRFQDYRNGVFSTVPRDGVFRIKDGKIVESWSGIRISDSILNILSNVRSVSRETKNAKWWLEIEPSMMPYVLVDNVTVSKSF